MAQSSSPATFLLLDSFLPIGAVKLGRFVRLPYHPESAYQPQDPLLPADLLIPTLEENVKRILVDHKEDLGFFAAITRLFGTKGSSQPEEYREFYSRTVVTRRFLNAETHLDSMLADRALTTWLKEPQQLNAGKVFLVVGMKSFLDARVVESYKKSKGFSMEASLLSEEVVALLTAPGFRLGDLSGGAHHNSEVASSNSSTYMGEQVFAVEYRPLTINRLNPELEDVQQLGRSTYKPEEHEEILNTKEDSFDPTSNHYVLGVEGAAYQLILGDVDADEVEVEGTTGNGSVESREVEKVQVASGEWFMYAKHEESSD